MKKIAFVGAGSFGFTRGLVRDILTFPALEDSELALMDVDAERLGYIKKAVDRIVAEGRYPARVTATTRRPEALKNADAVVTTILASPLKVWRKDIEIPKKYGVDTNVGDSRGPSGIFRALRTIPVMVGICRDIERYAKPNAYLLNYTNPMAMLCRAMFTATRVQGVGLCHSVQGTAMMLAGWIGAPYEEVSYVCAGINHQAWYLTFRWNGKDAYPLIRKAVAKKDIYNREQVRNEMFLHLDRYVTESSGHNSEYNAWFRKRPDLIKRYCSSGTGWNPGAYAYIVKEYQKRAKSWRKEILEWVNDEKPLDLKRGHEYAASILNGLLGDHTPFEFNGNVRNFGLIDNLPQGACVEVPVVATKGGFAPVHVGPLPTQLAALNGVNSQCEELAVEGSLEGDPRKVFHAVCHDPLTSAVLSLAETKKMTDEMFRANRPYLPQFRHLN